MSKKNPKWSRQELMLALELYFRVNPAHASPSHPEVQALSALLNRIPHLGPVPDPLRYRNANGVYMKLCNFLRFDDAYTGSGLTRGGKLEESVWSEFASDRERLASICEQIKSSVAALNGPGSKSRR